MAHVDREGWMVEDIADLAGVGMGLSECEEFAGQVVLRSSVVGQAARRRPGDSMPRHQSLPGAPSIMTQESPKGPLAKNTARKPQRFEAIPVC